MADPDPQEPLHGLLLDLQTYADGRLSDLDRLDQELSLLLHDFKTLLDHPSKSDKSRHHIMQCSVTRVLPIARRADQQDHSDPLEIAGLEYAIRPEFREAILHVSDLLDLDERESAQACLNAHDYSSGLDRSLSAVVVIRFHKRRLFLLECLRLVLEQSRRESEANQASGASAQYLFRILDIEGDTLEGERWKQGHPYWQKCLASMGSIERWLQMLADREQACSIIIMSPEEKELLDLQRTSLTRQHESLAAICTYLIKDGYARPDSLRELITVLKTFDKLDRMLVHYVPLVIASIQLLVSRDSSLQDMRDIHNTLISNEQREEWKHLGLHAAVVAWWLVEYNGVYAHPLPEHDDFFQRLNIDKEAEKDKHSQLFLESLSDGAFQLMLSLSQDIRPKRLCDPTNARLLFLMLPNVTSSNNLEPASDFFRAAFNQQMQGFVDSCIVNMPDQVRELKVEQDDKRRMAYSRCLSGAAQHDRRLETFFLIISDAFYMSPDAAEGFWIDAESSPDAFLRWAAVGLTTPRAAAFCEMLISLSGGKTCATHANAFLHGNAYISPGKTRHSASLDYNVIVAELRIYADAIKDQQAPSAAAPYQRSSHDVDHLTEPETVMMLECYLRLLAHVLRESRGARDWISGHPDFVVQEKLLQLAPAAMDSTIRANVFNVLGSLLADNTVSIRDSTWDYLDAWSMPHTGTSSIHTRVYSAAEFEQNTLQVGCRYDEAVAFMSLLTALVSPCVQDTDLLRTLPFPGAPNSRFSNSGIDKYIDLALDHIFATLCPAIEDAYQSRVLRWHCLNFIAMCLSTFDESSVISADPSVQNVYVRLHPFARVMDWILNDNVMRCLFAATHEDIDAVNEATSDALLLCPLVKSIEVLGLVMSLENTYVNLVRKIRSQSSTRREVANSALASFDDAVLKQRAIVIDLGLYCGTGHLDLTRCSIHLLQMLACSAKLSVSLKAIRNMESGGDLERICKAWSAQIEVNPRELEQESEALGYLIKVEILQFLDHLLGALPDRPTVAHLLLGFDCGTDALYEPRDGLFADERPLCRSVLSIAVGYPAMIDNSFAPWSSRIKHIGINILTKLWRSSLSSKFVMPALRNELYFRSHLEQQNFVDADTLFAGLSITDADFLLTPSALALEYLLKQRTAFYEYTARELLLVEHSPDLRREICAHMLHSSLDPESNEPSVLDFFDPFDHMDLDLAGDFEIERLPMLRDFNLKEECLSSHSSAGPEYDIQRAKELINIRLQHLYEAGEIDSHEKQDQTDAFVEFTLVHLQGVNQRTGIIRARRETFKTWAWLIIVLLEKGEFADGTRSLFVQQAIQKVRPKLKKAYDQDVITAIDLADLARALLANIDFETKSIQETGWVSGHAKDGLQQLFRVALDGLTCLDSNAELREICYQICYYYLRGTTDPASQLQNNPDLSCTSSASLKVSARMKRPLQPPNMLSPTMLIIKACGTRVLDSVLDDSLIGRGTCRVSALLFLDTLVLLDAHKGDNYVINYLAQVNFISALVDGIRQIPMRLEHTAEAHGTRGFLSFIGAYLALLFRIAQTKTGSRHIYNASLFRSIAESRIFSMDPDLVFEMNPDALYQYYDLMLDIMRIVNAVIAMAPLQDEQLRQRALNLLVSNQSSITALFKRVAGGFVARCDAASDALAELSNNLCLLIVQTDFLEFQYRPFDNRDHLA